jgi:CheY-like chemotaxis protein
MGLNPSRALRARDLHAGESLRSLPTVAMPSPLKTKSKSPSSSRPKILTVDDAKAVRLLAQRALASFECDVDEAPNGFNALFAMEKSLPDLILLDVNMPTMGGVEMLSLMRSNPTLRDIPVIMLTSPADHAVSDRLTELGVRGRVMKPFSPSDLVEKIRSVLTLQPRPTTP